MNTTIIFFLALALIVLLLIVWYISIYNELIERKVKVEEAFSTMDVFLKKRFDLIPNLVKVVKSYADYEEEVFSNIASLRSNINITHKEQIENENKIYDSISKMFIIAEGYPNLKADKHFLELQMQLKSIEDDIEKSRRYYNGTVKHLNIKVNSIPSNIVAKLSNIKEEPFFEIKESIQRENVNVGCNG